MFRIIQIVLFLGIGMQVHAQGDTLRFDPGSESTDSLEYELIVLDPGYESFLVLQPSMEFYAQFYYEMWNSRYVTEWNYRHMNPMQFGTIYEVYIDYQESIDYGLELNYRLYYYFKFFEKENDVVLVPGKVL